MTHKWKFTVNDDGSFSAEVARPEDSVHDCFEKEAFRALKNEVDRLKDILRVGIVLVEKGDVPGYSAPTWLDRAREAVR